jgi:hypothetical protein
MHSGMPPAVVPPDPDPLPKGEREKGTDSHRPSWTPGLIPSRRLLLYALLAAALHGAAALATSSEAVFYVVVATAQRLFGGSIGARSIFDDVDIYHRYASAALGGLVPYRDFVVEYPVLAFPLFVLPRLFATSRGAYQVAFGAEMLAFDAMAVYLVARRVERAEGSAAVLGRIGWYSLGLLALGPLPVSRFDLAPTALAFAAALAWSSGREVRGGLAAGVGTLMKVFPAAIVAPAAVGDLSRARGRGLLAFALMIGAGTAGWVALAGGRVRDSLAYHLGRGLEISSVYSGLLIVAARAVGAPLGHDFNHTSEELISPWSSIVATLAPAVQVAALLLVAWRLGRGDGVRAAGAAVLAFVVTGKVLSPQYLIWLVPFVAVLGGKTGRRARPLLLAGALATSAVYPWSFMGLIRFHPLAVALLNLRNGLLLALLGVLLFGAEAAREGRP